MLFLCALFFILFGSKSLLFIAFVAPFFFSQKLFRLSIYVSLVTASSIIVLVILSMAAQTFAFFKLSSISDFFFGTIWQPNYTVKDGVVVKLFGILPLLFGTLLIAFFATIFSVPIGVLSAVLISYFISKKQRNIAKPMIEAMAGIPTVVYGYFALNFISPFILWINDYFSVNLSTENTVFAGLIVGIMVIPVVVSLIDDLLHSVPKSLYYGAAALGSTTTEIILRIALPYALPGIFSVILLSFSRALGETMIVLMLAGVAANFTFNPLESVTTITVQIATLLTGDQAFNSEEGLVAYALGLALFIFTWILNAFAIALAKRYSC